MVIVTMPFLMVKNTTMRNVFVAFALMVTSLTFAQEVVLKTVHLESDEMDLYLDLPETSEVTTFEVHKEHTLFGKKAFVSIHMEKGSDLGDVYLETFEKDLKELDKIKDHGELKTMFKSYYRHTETDLIMEFEEPDTKKIFYEFHYVTSIGGKQFYFCSDPTKHYTLEEVLEMHKIAETLRDKK